MCGSSRALRNLSCSNRFAVESAARTMKTRRRTTQSSRRRVAPQTSIDASSCRLASGLAFRAIEAGALADDDVSDRRRACVARFSLTAVYAQTRGKAAGLSARIAIAAKGRAVAADRGTQDYRHLGRDFFDLAAGDAAGSTR